MRKLLIAAIAVVAAVAVFVVLRPDGADEPAATGRTDSGTRVTLEVSTAPPLPARVTIAVRNGGPVGGVRRVTVARGRRVILIVTSDVADHVHLHGYDVMRDVAPGRPARLDFRATIAGTVEAELEDRHVLLARITAQP